MTSTKPWHRLLAFILFGTLLLATLTVSAQAQVPAGVVEDAPAAEAGPVPTVGGDASSIPTGTIQTEPTKSDASISSPKQTTEPNIVMGTIQNLITILTKGSIPVDLEKQREDDLADGVERLTDNNLEDVIGSASEDDVFVILIHGPNKDAISPLFTELHKNATILAKSAAGEGDDSLSHVRWARLDFTAEWKSCARWLVLRAPFLAVVAKNGNEIRFIAATRVRVSGDELYELMKTERWKSIPVWKSRYGPGGDRAFLTEAYITAQAQISKVTDRVPNWAILLGSGAIAQAVMKWLHTPAAAGAGAGTRPAQR